ncbi:CAP domain-containing protein [Actinoplanes sp. NPDC049118]|uniref:CAP domain-containing protein n=1 Tax=Actinoplanes sp. NPDC049118 TaxID=3155769 RepID=UPI0033E26571
MRRPALVAAAAVSAVLAGGIMVATTAGAEETPDALAVPSIQWPDLAGVPQLPVIAGVPDVPDVAAVPADPGPVAVQGGPIGQGEPADDAGPARPGGAAKPAAGVLPAANDRPDRPAADDDAAGAAVDDDRRTKPTQADKPAAPAAPAAAQRDVTVGQALSTDPRSAVQQRALDMVNQYRRRAGCDDVTVDRRLILAANRHAADMARRGYFAHEDTRGDRAGERVEDAGYRWRRFGENIARGQESVYEVVEGWMDSPAHRENILDCGLHQVGLGLAFAGDRTSYWVQDFATPQ